MQEAEAPLSFKKRNQCHHFSRKIQSYFLFPYHNVTGKGATWPFWQLNNVHWVILRCTWAPHPKYEIETEKTRSFCTLATPQSTFENFIVRRKQKTTSSSSYEKNRNLYRRSELHPQLARYIHHPKQATRSFRNDNKALRSWMTLLSTLCKTLRSKCKPKKLIVKRRRKDWAISNLQIFWKFIQYWGSVQKG